MAMLKTPDSWHEWLTKVQAGFKFKYNKVVSQIKILAHLDIREIESNDYDKVIDSLYVKVTKYEQEQKNEEKKTNSILSE